MKITAALREADRLVFLDGYGRGQARVRHWSSTHRAWWEGHITTLANARRIRHEERIAMALKLMGIEDADELAFIAAENYPRDWRQCVRDVVRGVRAVEQQEGEPNAR